MEAINLTNIKKEVLLNASQETNNKLGQRNQYDKTFRKVTPIIFTPAHTMNGSFTIPVAFPGKDYELNAHFQRWGYTHWFTVLIGE